MDQIGGWSLTLGETAVLEPSDGRPVFPGRKTSALLAYLAREGPTLRSRLADLLWPDAASSRASLRQMLHDLRQVAPIVEAGDPMSLSDAVTVRSSDGALLSAHDYADCPAFEEWLHFRREADRAHRLEALRSEMAEHERSGRHEQALSLARQALALDPLSETAHRNVMRLTYLSGDRAGALHAYHRCQAVLEEQLGLQPLPETVALARSIERAASELPDPRRRAIPVTVDRPPVLAGRAEAWKRMERAWENGQVIYLSGAPGVGKTRLMHDFAASKIPRSRWNVFTARPGDATTPYASQARAFRAVLDACDGIELTEVMKHELGRLLPDYASEAPKPMTSLEEKNFFYATLAEVLILSGAWLDCWIADDWQFVDTASLEMASYMFANVTPVATERKGQRAICTFRTHEVGDDFRAFLADLVRGGIAVHIELEPLDRSAVRTLLASTEVPGAANVASEMHRFTGGTPLFVVETLKALLEVDQAEIEPERLAEVFPERVATIFDERFRRLAWGPMRFLEFLAVAQTDASADLAMAVLGVDRAELAEVRSELEDAALTEGFAFRHDLVYEAVRHATPKPVRTFLHRRVAEEMTEQEGTPSRVAYHYITAGAEDAAVPHLLTAAEEALVRGAFEQAADWYRWLLENDVGHEHRALAAEAIASIAELQDPGPAS